jgi:hypothetical protein
MCKNVSTETAVYLQNVYMYAPCVLILAGFSLALSRAKLDTFYSYPMNNFCCHGVVRITEKIQNRLLIAYLLF